MDAIVAIQKINAADTAAAQKICKREDILMKRTCPSDRMKNSRSGNQVANREPIPCDVVLCKTTLVPIPYFWRGVSTRVLSNANPLTLLRDERSESRDELLIWVNIHEKHVLPPCRSANADRQSDSPAIRFPA